MSKITLAQLGNISNTTDVTTINSDLTIIQNGFDNTLSLDGTAPNQMAANLDMDSNRILNLPAPISADEPARLQDLATIDGGGTITVSNLPTGGTINQALKKNSSSNYDVGWSNCTLPTASDTLVGRATTDTLTNKTISGSSNTLTVLATSQLSGSVPLANGGTAGTDASTARTNLGLGTAAVLNSGTSANNVLVMDGSGNVAAVATQANQETGTSLATLVTPARQQYHPSAAKAWVVFDGTASTPITPAASYNVTNVTKSATGTFVVNFTTAFSSANYATVGSTNNNAGNLGIIRIGVPTTGNCPIKTTNIGGTDTDFSITCVTFYGDQ